MSSESTQQSKSDEQRAWESTPNMVVTAMLEQGRQLHSQERFERAEEIFAKVVRMRPEVASCWTLLGLARREQHKLVPALHALQRAADLDPSDRETLVHLGEVLILARKVPEGAKVLRAVFEAGYDEELPPEEHDPVTRRAGAGLALLGKVCEAVEEAAN